jgi:hypothetical protein
MASSRVPYVPARASSKASTIMDGSEPERATAISVGSDPE